MARVLIRTQAWGVVTSRAGDALASLTFAIKNTDGSAATHWSAETGGTSSTATLTTDTLGGATLSGADRWIEVGEYDVTTNGSTYRVNTSGSLPDVYMPKPSGDASGATDRARANAAIAALPGAVGTVRLQPGGYVFDATVNVPANVDVIGAGMGSTTVTANGNFFVFSFTGFHSKIASMTLNATSSQTSAGGGIDYTHVTSVDLSVEWICFGNNLFAGLNMTPNISSVGVFRAHHLRWEAPTGSNYGIIIGDDTHHVSDVDISDVIATAGAAGAGMAQWWVQMKFCDTIKLTDCTFYQGTNGILIGSGGITTGVRMTGMVVDSLTGPGMQLNNYQDLECVNSFVQGCSSSGGFAVFMNGAGGRWIGGGLQVNKGYGLVLGASSTYSKVIGATVANNNTSNTAFNDGIAAASGASHFMVANCTSGNSVLTGAGNAAGFQRNGISTTGTSDYYHIVNNDCPGNITAGVSDGASGTHKTVSGNL